MKKLAYFIPFVVILFLTIGFSALEKTLLMDDVEVVVRPEKDIRVTNVESPYGSNSGISQSMDYNVDNINGKVSLPNSSSTVKYTVTVTNIGNVDMGILSTSVTANGSEGILKATINPSDYVEGDRLCNTNNVCNSGISRTFDVTIGYVSGASVLSGDINFIATFDFREYFTITYNGFTNTTGLDTGVLAGDTKNIVFTNTNPIPSVVSVSGATSTYINSTLTISNATGNVTVTRNYKVTYVDFTGDTSGLVSSLPVSGGTITFDSSSGIPSSVTVTGATGTYTSPNLIISSVTGDITITSINGGGSGTPGGTDIIENEDGSTTTITYDENGNPAEATNEITDSSGNTTTQEITYVNGEEVVTGYSIDTSNNSNGGLSVPSEGIDTGVLAFDGNDFEVTLKATFSFANCTATICPIINVTKKNTSVNGVLIYEDRIATSGYGHNSSGTNVNPPYNKFRIGKYVTSAPTGSVDYNIISKITSTQGNGRYGYNSSSTPVTLTIKLYYTSGVFTSEIYDSSGATDVLLAKPYNNTTLTFSDTGTDFDNITIQLGTFESGTTIYPTHNFEIIDFNVTKTVN